MCLQPIWGCSRYRGAKDPMLYTGTGQYQILQVRLVRVPADDACMTVCDTQLLQLQLVTGTVPVSYLVDQISVLYAKTYQKCGTSRSGGRQILPVVSEMVQWLRRDINKPEARGSNPAVCIPGFFHFPTELPCLVLTLVVWIKCVNRCRV